MANEKPQKQADISSISKIEQELIRSNPHLFQGVPKEKREEIVRTFISVKMHSGPLPPAEMLEQYELISPGSSKIILDVFQKQSNHRMDLESTVIKSQQKRSDRGQHYALIIALAVLAGAFTCILRGFEISGSFLGSIDLVALVTVFIIGKNEQTKDLEKKRPPQQTAKRK